MIRTAILLLLALTTVPLHAVSLQPFTAHYDVVFSGLGGDLVSSVGVDDDGLYVFENRTRARGIARLARPKDAVDRSEFRLEAERLVPLHFSSEDGTRRNKRGNEVVFDWGAGTAASEYEGERLDIELDRGMLDRQLMQLAMMSDLAEGVQETSYRVIDRHDVKTYEITVLGTERVSVPAGDYEAVKVRRQRAGSSRATLMWCAPELDYLPVLTQQLKNDKVIATLSLTQYE